jgi:hypothetical protein
MLIPPKVLNAVKCSSGDVSRYQITSVYLERKSADSRPTITATSGKVIARVSWREDNPGDFPAVGLNLEPKEGFTCILPRKAAEELSKHKANSRYPILNNIALDEHSSNGTATFATTDLDAVRKLEPNLVEGTYPKYETVLGPMRKKGTVEVLVNPTEMIRALQTLIKSTGMDKEDFCKLSAKGGREPVVFSFKNKDEGIDGIVGVMPLVAEGGGK